MPDYQQLLERLDKLQLISTTASVLSWDQETQLPVKAVEYRSRQLAWLSGLYHENFTNAKFGELLELEPENADQAADLKVLRRQFARATKIPTALVEEEARLAGLAFSCWQEARAKSDFSLFEPQLARLVDIKRQMAEHFGYDEHPYDALLEDYEPGATTKQLTPIFSQLENSLSALLPSAMEKSTGAHHLNGIYPVSSQEAFSRQVATALGFDFQAGRIDSTVHPFCTTLGCCDVRLTTRYDESDFLSALYGTIHETGHGLYEQGLPPELFCLPRGAAVSLGIHESQSRLWENHIARRLSFWHHWLPEAQKHFKDLHTWTPEAMTSHVQRVTPSFIRVEADELTYDLHIALRFNLERDLISGQLQVKDIPEHWNQRFESLFGLQVPDDRNGCLQDIHHSHGSFGYFPTYTLGNLNAAQIMAKIESEIPDLDQQLERGNYYNLLSWLRQSIHCHGSHYMAQDLMIKVTGEPTQPRYYLQYLDKRYR